MTKVCAKCGEILALTNFSRRLNRGEGKTHAWCRQCRAESERARRKKLRASLLVKERERYIRRREDPRELASKNRYVKVRYQTDENFRIKMLLSCRLRSVLRGVRKSSNTESLLGCSIDQLLGHLEINFLPGMTWKNSGSLGWHIDHRRPCASFDLTNPEEQKACFNWRNLQPMWATENYKKGIKWRETAP